MTTMMMIIWSLSSEYKSFGGETDHDETTDTFRRRSLLQYFYQENVLD